jgi:hypothetical protein
MYGVAGNELIEIKQAIAGLQKGELMIKNNDAILMGFGKKYKKIMVRHLIQKVLYSREVKFIRKPIVNKVQVLKVS